MANLPEKNITTVDKITSIPSNTNLYINANGEFRQATIDDVLKASPVIADSIANQYKNASGSPILLTDSAKGVAIEFNAKGRSTQDGEPTPTEPITPKSNGDMGYFDGELLQGLYNSGVFVSDSRYVCSKNPIPCDDGDIVKLAYGTIADTICFHFYDKDMNYMSYQYSKASSECEVTVPTGAKYINFYLLEPNTSITPQTAKHICVTINGKYALIVDSVGKNELNNTATSQTINGVTFTVNEDKSITVSGTATATASFVLNSNMLFDVESYILNGCPSGGSSSTYKLDVLDTKGSILVVDSGNGVSFDVTSAFTSQGVRIVVYGGVTANNLKFYPMLRLASITDDTYEPYKESRKYIPISAPLRSSLDGSVSDVARLTEGKVTRRIVTQQIITVYKTNTTADNYCYYARFGNVGSSNKAVSNRLSCISMNKVTANGTDNIGICETSLYGGVVYINVGKYLTENTVEGMTAWLAENPTYVQYELAEPTSESVEPIDVETFEGVTQISVSDNADMEVEYPTSKVAGIASIGWSKGRRAEYDLEQLKAQMLALQTTIVSTV